MNKNMIHLGSRQDAEATRSAKIIMESVVADNSSPDRFAAALPFSVNDTTAASETELQVAVKGNKTHIDLVATIEESDYYAKSFGATCSGITPVLFNCSPALFRSMASINPSVTVPSVDVDL
jgi:hypothetical protein